MNFILIAGPPAVGKMTVGQALSKRLGYPLFHNHHSIELTLDLFAWGTPEFKKINSGIRELVFNTAAQSENITGFIFTLVIAFDLEEDLEEVRRINRTFQEQGARSILVELYALLDTRLERNQTPNRLAHKPSKRKLELSEENLRRMEQKYSLNSEGSPLTEMEHLRVDNTDLSADEVAAQIVEHFRLEG